MDNFKKELIEMFKNEDIFSMSQAFFNERDTENPFTEERILELESAPHALEYCDVLRSLLYPFLRHHFGTDREHESPELVEKGRACEAKLDELVITLKDI